MKLGFAEIERSMFEAIRKKVVSLGYLPDITLYEGDEDGYENAKNVIRNSGKKIIEVMNIGDPKARHELNYNTIVINRDDINKGSLGFYGTTSKVPVYEGETIVSYDYYQNESGTVDIEYQISFIADDTIYDRLIQTIIFNSLRLRGYMKGIDENGDQIDCYFHIQYRTTLDKSGNDYLERAMRYDILDATIEDKVFLYNRPVITVIETETVAVDVISDDTLSEDI